MLIGALSAAGLLLSVIGLVTAFGERSPRLDVVRWLCLALTGSLLGVSLIGVLADWTVLLSCLSFLVSLPAVAIASYAEGETVEREPAGTVDGEPAWWPEFERDFRRYACRASEGRETA
jgi:hypothetical protein